MGVHEATTGVWLPQYDPYVVFPSDRPEFLYCWYGYFVSDYGFMPYWWKLTPLSSLRSCLKMCQSVGRSTNKQ